MEGAFNVTLKELEAKLRDAENTRKLVEKMRNAESDDAALQILKEHTGENDCKRKVNRTSAIKHINIALVLLLILGGCFNVSKKQVSPSEEQVSKKSTNTSCDHIWSPATCTSPKTCEICGEVSGSSLEHQWADATYYAPKTCRICSVTEGEKIKVDPIYINNMDYCEKKGKLWTRSEDRLNYPTHPNAKDTSVWKQEDIQGHTVGEVLDNQGNKYQYGLHLDGSKTQSYYVSYELGGKYTSFSGWCAFPGKLLSEYARYSEKYIEIYADGELVYITGAMNIDSDPEYIEIDVTNVQILTIQYPASKNPNEAATLYDGMLS